MASPASNAGSPSPSLSSGEAQLLGLCSRISAVQRRTAVLAGREHQAELLGDRAVADALHGRQVRLVAFRHRLIGQLCDMPATSGETRRAKSAALLTLVTLDPIGRPEQLEEAALWSACRDLAYGDETLPGFELLPPEALGKALRIVWQAARHWELDEGQTRRLLGSLPEGAVRSWFRHDSSRVGPDLRRRIGLVVALHRRLKQRYAWPDRGFDWITRPHPQLGGRSPLTRMLDGGVDDLLAVHAALDDEEDAEEPHPSAKRLRPVSGPLEAELETALAVFCDRERGELASPEKRDPPAPFVFPSWEAVERWVWDGDGDDDAPIRMRLARLLVLARRVIGDEGAVRRWLTGRQVWIGHKSPLASAATPGGLHRAEGLLRAVEEDRRRLHRAGIPPDSN